MRKSLSILSFAFIFTNALAKENPNYIIEPDCVGAAIAAGDLAESLGSSYEDAYNTANDVYDACMSGRAITLTTAME